MAPSSKQGRKFCLNLGATILCALGLATFNAGSVRAQAAAETGTAAKSEGKPDPKADSKTSAKTGEKRPVKDNVKQLGREVSDPTTLQRIKAHEQELEKKVESRREHQRKDHGAARPSDAVDLAKSLDKPAGAAAAAKPEPKPDTKTSAKPKNAAVPAPPAASKPAPTPK